MAESLHAHPAVTEWRIHLGAHKTASTHVQHVLGDMRGALLADGFDVLVPHQGLREQALTRLAARRRKHRFPFLARATELTRLVEPLRQGPPRIILSEEGLLGWTQDVIAGRFYSGLGYAFAVLDRLAAQSEVTLFLAIRSPDTFLPSIYAEALRHGPPPEDGFDAVRAWVRRDPPRWTRLIAEIRRWAPKARLVIWRYEDFRAHEADILSRLCGRPVIPPAVAPETAHTRSGSARAVAMAERIAPSLRGPERQAAVNAIFADPAFDGPAFRPFDAEETAVLKRLYAADTAEIDRIAPGSLLRFP
jgi:hypothetical protein